jgi:cardiolipin synthase
MVQAARLPLTRRGACGASLAGSAALAACAHFPELPRGGAGDPVEADPLFREAMGSAPVLPGNRVAFLYGGRRVFAALFRAVEAARDHVNLEFYIFKDVGNPGGAGPSLFDLLRSKLGEGVAVTIIYDSIGSAGTPDAALASLRDAGANLLSYNPANPFEARGGAWRPNARNHRKVAVVDGRVAGIGGVNLDSVYENPCGPAAAAADPADSTDDACWADIGMRVEGPAVAALQRLFFETWAKQGGGPLPARNWFPPPGQPGRTAIRVFGSAPGEGKPRFYVARLAALMGATRSIRLCTGYFVPTPRELEELARAARRGVDVRLLLPGVTDTPIATAAQRASYGRLLEAGARIVEVTDSVLHAKIAVVDGAWSAVGSSNLDRRSAAWNDEVDAVLLGPEAGAELEAAMARAAARATPVTLEGWRRRPVGQRLRELLSWPVADLL